MKRSRNSNTPVLENPVVIDEPWDRIRTICEILCWHTYLPSNWILAHFPHIKAPNRFKNLLGHLREEQNAYIRKSDWPLNYEIAVNKHLVYELGLQGAKLIERKLPRHSRQETAHDLIVSLHECSLKFQAQAAGVPFQFLEPEEYTVSPKRRWRPDGHPFYIGHEGKRLLGHSEIERRKWNESPEDTEEKIEKAYEYVRSGAYKLDAESALVFFLSATTGRTNALKQYVAEKYGKCSFFCFGTSKDWVQERSFPDPKLPLVPVWDRVGHPPLNLFAKEVH